MADETVVIGPQVSSMVAALRGDSTITSFVADIPFTSPVFGGTSPAGSTRRGIWEGLTASTHLGTWAASARLPPVAFDMDRPGADFRARAACA